MAIRDNSLEIIELLLAFGADPALRDNKGNTGLHVAAALGASACLQLLAGNTKHKDDLNELNDCGKRSRVYHVLIYFPYALYIERIIGIYFYIAMNYFRHNTITNFNDEFRQNFNRYSHWKRCKYEASGKHEQISIITLNEYNHEIIF